MKKLLLIGLFLLSSLAGNAQDTIDWDYVKSRYYEKYKPSKNPAWVFPLIFKEGSGQRDTIYMVYDKDANWGYVPKDTIFGEKKYPFDTSFFIANWGGSQASNGWARKISAASPLEEVMGYYPISFYKATLPLTVYWDRNAFYSDSLPFAASNQAPRAQGLFTYDLPMRVDHPMLCSFQYSILLTDSLTRSQCSFSDSVVFEDDFNRQGVPAGIISIKIEQWTGQWTGDNEMNSLSEKYNVYPNPASQYLFIEAAKAQEFQVNMYDMTGRQVFQGSINSPMTEVDVSSLKEGVYLVKVTSDGAPALEKIIVQH